MKPSKLQKILDYAFPITEEDRRCRIKMQKLHQQREELTKLVEAYRKEQEYNSPLLIRVDLTKIREMMNN